MILKSLYMRNYRTYRGPEEVFFADGEKNITIIKGNNEVGKTTIMNAITWCLYGGEFYKSKGNEPIWNNAVSDELGIGDEDSVEVNLIMQDSKGKEVKFIRTVEFYKNDLGECKQGSIDSQILVDNIPVSFKDLFIEKHLPQKIREYFLFDGEQLETYFTEDNEHIKKSVQKLSQLNLLKNARKHLNTREKEFTRELDKVKPELARLLKKQKEVEEKLEDRKETLSKTEKNIKEWNIKKEKAEEEISQYGKNPKALIEKKKGLINKKNNINIKISKKNEEYNKFLLENLPRILSYNSLIKVKNICHDLEQKGFIPARYKKEFLEYLLERHECICGADLSEGSDAYNKMVELWEKTPETTNIEDTVNILLGSINNILSNFPTNFMGEMKEKRKEIDDLNQDLATVSTEITDIETRLSKSDEDEIKRLQGKITTYENLISTNTEKKGKYKQQIENLKEEWKELEEKIIIERGKTGIQTDLQASIDLCKTALKEIDKIYKELEQDMHTKLQSLTSEEFDKIHWKGFYEGVSIDEDYNVTIHKDGRELVPNDLSKGGKLVLALSFMTALNSLSGFELPIIIDTPMGRLDEPIKENIGKYLPMYTRNKQVTLLVTTSEYSEAFRKAIRSAVGKEYSLNYIEEKGGITTIE